MLEWLAAATGVELGKFVLEQVLNLGKAALEDYVKDFFKGCLQSGVARANADALKKPMAEAIGFFIKRFVKELQINEVPETSINHHYKAAIKRFVQDKAVRPTLGKAFEKNCKQIDYAQLEKIWMDSYQVEGWQFPAEEFDWRGVGKEYVYEVKGIVKANSELRSLLDTELLEDIARNTAQISPGFDVEKYRESLQCSYGYLKLYTLDSTDRVDAIKLWSMFIEQTVREALPPTRYELPLDLKRRLQEEGQLGDDLSPEALEHYRREYFQQPARKVLEVVGDTQRIVILGDPGSGKSSLLQYLALEWVEGKTETLPLLIELREFALAQSESFLEFLHRGRGVDWQFDQQQLHQHLLENQTLVMFDGLDEVFDRATQATVVDDIVRFSRQYPKARVLVTSRIIGYNPERLQHAEFQHFTLQSLDTDEIHEFINRWYDLSMGNDPDKVRLKQRLKDAIANSKAIQNLADNPLLLTMMAILNRRQELPRDRADLYDQASRVLLYHWDVDHKRLQLPMDAIGRREKQEMLCLISYEMQAGEEGLKGNLIGNDRLTRVLTDYLRDQGFSEPREKANLLIQQLRERNFILCYRGADTYGFMHRTFLEYFCAVEIVHRFEKQHTLTFDQLRDKVFGQHWQDETWHEVLRILCGMISTEFTGRLIEYLIVQNGENYKFINSFLAAKCLFEVKDKTRISIVSSKLLSHLKELSSYGESMSPSEQRNPLLQRSEKQALIDKIRPQAISSIADIYQGDLEVLQWLKDRAQSDEHLGARQTAVKEVAKGWKSQADTFKWLKNCAQFDPDQDTRHAAVRELALGWKDHPEILTLLKKIAQSDVDEDVRRRAIWELVRGWKEHPDTFYFLCNCVITDPFQCDYTHTTPRQAAIEKIIEFYLHQPETASFLRDRAIKDSDEQVRAKAIKAVSQKHEDVDAPDLLDFLCSCAEKDPFQRTREKQLNPRQTALESLLKHYPTHSKTIELLRDRAINDPDSQLREWAKQQLETQGQIIES